MKDSDIKAIAEALIASNTRYSPANHKYFCNVCDGGFSFADNDLEHTSSCPALIAEKLLEEMK